MKPFSQLADDILKALFKAVEARDTYTKHHMVRTSKLATAVARRIGLSDDQVEVVAAGALLHDCGKIGIPDAILSKPGRLTAEEYEVMKSHPVIGEEICQPMKPVADLVRTIRNHHERLDGAGYPDGLKGDEIPPATRVVCVTEIYDALYSDRPYRNAMPYSQVCDILDSEARRGWWDRDVVKATIAETESEHSAARSVA